MSVDRQLLDAASTNGADEVDCSGSAAVAHPVNGCFRDFEFHCCSLSDPGPCVLVSVSWSHVSWSHVSWSLASWSHVSRGPTLIEQPSGSDLTTTCDIGCDYGGLVTVACD